MIGFEINEERRKQSMINPAAAMKVMKAKNQFVSNHPKFAAFFRNVLTGGVQEGTVIEITVTRPGEEPMTTICVYSSQILSCSRT